MLNGPRKQMRLAGKPFAAFAVVFLWLTVARGAQAVLLTPPPGDGSVAVRATFHLLNINSINDGAETFDFSGVLTLAWNDSRRAFDPMTSGVDEKIYQGPYQVAELAAGWYPQVVLANSSGMYDKYGTLLRIKPDGTCTLVEMFNATAETKLNLRKYPYDSQRLEAIFGVLGFGADEVVLESSPSPESLDWQRIRIPQWLLKSLRVSTRDVKAPHAGMKGVSSSFVVSMEIQRDWLFIVRLVVLPLVLIVVLSWSVFWMERSSLGDRMAVSFVGILTAVTYQLVVSDILPQISYVTLIHAFLNFSFWIMCLTVVVNLAVGACDKKGLGELGDRIDRRCRWAFPLVYVLFLAGTVAVFVLFF